MVLTDLLVQQELRVLLEPQEQMELTVLLVLQVLQAQLVLQGQLVKTEGSYMHSASKEH